MFKNRIFRLYYTKFVYHVKMGEGRDKGKKCKFLKIIATKSTYLLICT